LFRAAASGGAQALGQKLGVLEAGAVASLVVLDGNNPFISTAKDDQILDRWIFALGDSAVRDVMVAGEWRLTNGRHKAEEEIDRAFSAAMNRLARN
jgi:formimidoylglutamate deiminase